MLNSNSFNQNSRAQQLMTCYMRPLTVLIVLDFLCSPTAGMKVELKRTPNEYSQPEFDLVYPDARPEFDFLDSIYSTYIAPSSLVLYQDMVCHLVDLMVFYCRCLEQARCHTLSFILHWSTNFIKYIWNTTSCSLFVGLKNIIMSDNRERGAI